MRSRGSPRYSSFAWGSRRPLLSGRRPVGASCSGAWSRGFLVPALCFFSKIEQGVLELDIFPQEIQDALKQGTTFTPSVQLHIVHAHTLGKFPAEFKVDI